MKLLYLHGTPLDSESANVIQVINMCEAFAQHELDVVLAIPNPNNKNITTVSAVTKQFGYKPNFEIVTYKKITILNRLNTLGTYFGAKKILKKYNYDIDLCYVRSHLLLKLAIKMGIPTIYESHNYLLHNTIKFLDHLWRKSLIKDACDKKLLKFITISQALANYWEKNGVPQQKILALQDGFNSKSFTQSKSRTEARKLLDLPIDKKIVVYAGRLYADREPERIIQLAENFPSTLFVVVGGPEKERKLLSDKTSNMNVQNILWIGQVSHSKVKDYLFAADILLMIWSKKVPTINYFSSLKMFEYMAAGRVIVGQAYPTVKEVLQDGKSAYLANPDSFDDLVHKTNLALQEEYPSEIAHNAQKLAFNEYSWSSRALKIISNLT